MKTRKEVEDLKKDWDESWDIEDTEGFEEYRDELVEYSQKVKEDVKRLWAKKCESNIIRVSKIGYQRVESTATAIFAAQFANSDPEVRVTSSEAIKEAVSLLEKLDSGNW